MEEECNLCVAAAAPAAAAAAIVTAPRSLPTCQQLPFGCGTQSCFGGCAHAVRLLFSNFHCYFLCGFVDRMSLADSSADLRLIGRGLIGIG
jgi:hypothetical protein